MEDCDFKWFKKIKISIKKLCSLFNKQTAFTKAGIVFISVFLSFCFLFVLVIKAKRALEEDLTTPEGVIRAFYEAIEENDCAKAEKLRPGYPEKSCMAISEVKLLVKNIYKHMAFSNFANEVYNILYIEVDYRKQGVQKRFNGYVTLKQQGSSWIIRNESYKPFSRDDNENLTTYLNRLMADKESKQSSYQVTPQEEKAEETIQNPDEQLTITERPIVQEQAISSQSNTEKQSNIEVAKKMETRPSPPAAIKSPAAGLAFGSQTILSVCWEKDELSGSPQDKKIQALPKRDSAAPFKIKPDFLYRPLFHEQRSSIRYVRPYKDKKIIALTFDLCEKAREKAGYDADIVNYLREQNVKATFFAGGKWMKTHPEKTLQLMADPLFEIGNHSWTHGNFRLLTINEMKQQILWTQAQYELLRSELQKRPCVKPFHDEMQKIPMSIGLFRFPYGTCRSEALDLLSQYGLPAIQWNVVSGDPARRQTASAIKRVVLNKAKPGSIIIFHANGRGHGTARALPEIIQVLRKKGYTFVTVSELLYMGEIVATKTCYELKPGDNARYDKIIGKGID